MADENTTLLDDQDTTEQQDQQDTGDSDNETPASAVKEDGTPFTQADYDNLRQALSKARKDARTAARTAKGGSSTTDQPLNADGQDSAQAVADAVTAADAKYKPMVVRAHARAAFAEAGLVIPKDKADSALARAFRLLDLDDIDIDADGNVAGLEEQIADLRGDFPDLFTARNARPPKVDGANRETGSAQKQTSADKIAAAFLKGS